MRHLLLFAAAAALPAAASAQDVVVTARAEQPFDTPRVSDPVLATMRGGISLPNGLQVAIGIDIQTRVDNVLVLHTVYASDGPTAGVRIYTDGMPNERTPPGLVPVLAAGSANWPSVVVTRSPAGTTIQSGGATPASAVNLIGTEPGAWLNDNGQTRIPVVPNGAPVMVAPGSFSLTTDGNGSVVALDTDMLQIRHLVGQATGTAIANTANDRAIETVSAVDIDLQGGAALATMSGLFAADRLAVEAMSARQ